MNKLEGKKQAHGSLEVARKKRAGQPEVASTTHVLPSANARRAEGREVIRRDEMTRPGIDHQEEAANTMELRNNGIIPPNEGGIRLHDE
jgi:hypothetical protein